MASPKRTADPKKPLRPTGKPEPKENPLASEEHTALVIAWQSCQKVVSDKSYRYVADIIESIRPAIDAAALKAAAPVLFREAEKAYYALSGDEEAAEVFKDIVAGLADAISRVRPS
jgi:hypothetical protein